jgi:hypothetical protein
MARFLIVLGITFLLVGLLWSYLARVGLGRLPGDFAVRQNDNVIWYVPLATCLPLTLLFSVILWVVNR